MVLYVVFLIEMHAGLVDIGDCQGIRHGRTMTLIGR